MKKYIKAVMLAVGNDSMRPMYNKIAVYQKDGHFAFCATDGRRLHLSFTGGDLEFWQGSVPTCLLDAKKAKKAISVFNDLDHILDHCAMEMPEDFTLWANSIWVAMKSITVEERGSNFAVNPKYLKDALQYAVVDKDTEVQVYLTGDELSPIVVSSEHYIAVVMPVRSSCPKGIWRFCNRAPSELTSEELRKMF